MTTPTDNLNQLFEQKEKAWSHVKSLEMVNVFGKTTEERVAIDLAVENARQHWLELCSKYRQALEKRVKETK